MAGENIDNLTMEQYLTLTRGNQAPGMVRPKIRDNVNFEIKSQFMRELREYTFLGNKNDDTHEHIERVLDIVSLFNILGVTRDAVMLRDLLKKAFIQRYCPPSKTAKQLEDIHNFKQEREETLYQAWERCQLCGGPHLDKECPLNEDAKGVEEVKYGEGRSSPFIGTKYHVGPPGYYT
ncbi:hypothetical protein Tco_0163025 [Tanacetum coccineum]